MNRVSRIDVSLVVFIASMVVGVFAGSEATRHGVWALITACVCVFIVGTALFRLLGQWIKAAPR
ncbi:hypothetical protein [Tsukamurella paurometabola]|nr:hypothetical protein [Tsukamurella paurometabola]UEA81642.1 hypothetical protein LK411_14695 [Tsukamurella paurometabola]